MRIGLPSDFYLYVFYGLCCTNSHRSEKAKVLRLITFHYNISHLFYVSIKTMPNTTLDKAIAAIPKFRDRISLFTKKLRLAQYADGSIYDYRLKIAQTFLSTIVVETKPILVKKN